MSAIVTFFVPAENVDAANAILYAFTAQCGPTSSGPITYYGGSGPLSEEEYALIEGMVSTLGVIMRFEPTALEAMAAQGLVLVQPDGD